MNVDIFRQMKTQPIDPIKTWINASNALMPFSGAAAAWDARP